MATDPDEIRQFIERYIDCIDQLEAIRLMANDSDRMWDIGQLAEAVQSDLPYMEANLRALERRGLVASSGNGTRVWHYHPATPDLKNLTQAFLRSYLQRPVSVIRMVYAPRTTTASPQ